LQYKGMGEDYNGKEDWKLADKEKGMTQRK
jgi:hypothetical protein